MVVCMELIMGRLCDMLLLRSLTTADGSCSAGTTVCLSCCKVVDTTKPTAVLLV